MLGGIASCAVTGAAFACSPLPPPLPLEGETAEQYAARRQAEIAAADVAARALREAHEGQLLETSAQIVLTRVVELVPVTVELAPARRGRSAVSRRYTDIRFGVVAHIRGHDRAQQFELRHREHTAGLCDFRGDPESLDGLEVGELVLIFAGPGELGQEAFLEAISQSAAIAPGTLALFTSAAEQR